MTAAFTAKVATDELDRQQANAEIEQEKRRVEQGIARSSDHAQNPAAGGVLRSSGLWPEPGTETLSFLAEASQALRVEINGMVDRMDNSGNDSNKSDGT